MTIATPFIFCMAIRGVILNISATMSHSHPTLPLSYMTVGKYFDHVVPYGGMLWGLNELIGVNRLELSLGYGNS